MLNCQDLIELLHFWLDLRHSARLDLLDCVVTSTDHCNLHVRLGLRRVLAGHLDAVSVLLLNLIIRRRSTGLCNLLELLSLGLLFLLFLLLFFFLECFFHGHDSLLGCLLLLLLLLLSFGVHDGLDRLLRLSLRPQFGFKGLNLLGLLCKLCLLLEIILLLLLDFLSVLGSSYLCLFALAFALSFKPLLFLFFSLDIPLPLLYSPLFVLLHQVHIRFIN